MDNLAYLGGAEKWPTELNNLGQVTMTKEFDLISQSIIRYLSCPFGTEFFNLETGSRIEKLSYEPNDSLLQAMLETIISETIEKYEGRVRYLETEYLYDDDNEAVVFCRISVNILSKNEVRSFIWPYYNNEL